MTPTETTSNLPDWKSLTGKTLSGGYELKEIIKADNDQATLRVRVLGDYSLKAAASFYVLEKAQGEEQVAIWETARTVGDKRSLNMPLGTGSIELAGVPAIYLVFQTPDETLADVLDGRALETDEAVELLASLANGLEMLHSLGLVHGCLSPDNVLAVGNGIELSTGCVRRANMEPIVVQEPAKYLAPESDARNVTPASDIWCLGATLFEALTQKEYRAQLFEEAAALKHPFGSLLSGCIDPDPDKRCKLSELDRIVRSPAPPPKPKSSPVIRAPEAVATTPAITVAEPAQVAPVLAPPDPVTPLSAGVLPKLPLAAEKASSEPPKHEDLADHVPLRRRLDGTGENFVGSTESDGRLAVNRGWIYGAVAFLAIFFGLWLLRYGHRSQKPLPDAPQTSPSAAAKAPSAVTSTPAWPTKTLDPEAKSSAQSHINPKEQAIAAHKTSDTGKPVWRLVLFTYNRQSDADKKAQAINARHAELHAQVFSPSGSGKPYLVTAGGQMTREDAARERQRAVRAGMPRDSYIQNYSR